MRKGILFKLLALLSLFTYTNVFAEDFVLEKAEDLGNDFPVRVACTDAELTIPVSTND